MTGQTVVAINISMEILQVKNCVLLKCSIKESVEKALRDLNLLKRAFKFTPKGN